MELWEAGKSRPRPAEFGVGQGCPPVASGCCAAQLCSGACSQALAVKNWISFLLESPEGSGIRGCYSPAQVSGT